MTTAELCAAFEVGRSAVHAKARAIERAIGTLPFDPELSSLAEKNPLVWMAQVNDLPVNLREMPREVQEMHPDGSKGAIMNARVAEEP
jgi:hypothetical protein